ncbi:unnamed protein product [Caenorhabditis brenneri]
MSSHDINDVLAAVLILVNSSSGLYFHFIIIWNFIKDSKQRTSFNVICFFRAVNNVFVLGFAFLGVFLPAIVLGSSLYDPFIETIVIVIALNCNLFHSFQGVYFALNRLFAIFFPVKYYLFFKVKYYILFHFIIYGFQAWLISGELVYRHDTPAYLLFSTPRLAYTGLLHEPKEMYISSALSVGVPSVFNLFTFLKYHQLKKSTTRSSEQFKEAKVNMIRFLQTVLQDSLFSINVVFNMGIYTLIDHRLWTFCHTFVWQSLNVLDGELIHRHGDCQHFSIQFIRISFPDTRAYLLFSAPQLAYVGLLRASNEVYIFAAFFVGIPSVLNIFTFLRYHQLKRSSTRNSEKFEEAKRNMIRFLQTVLQDSLFSINVVFNTGIYTLIDHRLWSFFCHTFIWQSLNVLDGLVMFVFNEELSPVRNVIFSKVGPTNLQNIVSERVTTT